MSIHLAIEPRGAVERRDDRRLDGFLEPVGLRWQVERLFADVSASSSVIGAIGAVSRCVSSNG